MYNVKVWAHRGASGYAPENTLDAFKLAVEQGADGVELDVQMSADGQLVVIHDETVDRVSGVHGYVKDLSIEELKSLNVNKPHPEYEKVQIPTLREVYEILQPYGITINVELKTGIFWYPGLEEKVVRLTEEMGMCEQVIFSSFNHASIVKIRELAPHMQTAILYSDVIVDVVDYAEKLGVNALHPAVYHLKMADFVEKWVNSSLDVNVWTVNETADMEMLMKAGVHAVITNYPDLAVAVRKMK